MIEHKIIPISLVFTPDDVLPTFAVRLEEQNKVSFIDLTAQTLSAAYKEAIDLGYEATHCANKYGFSKIPSSIK